MQKVSVFLSVIIGLSLTACGEDIPSEAQGKKILVEKYEKSECLKLVDFKKTNGQKSEFGGVLAYQMEYSAVMELKNGCHGYFDEKNKTLRSPNKQANFTNPIDKKVSEQGHKNMINLGYRLVKEGEKFPQTGRINFGKKENGWEGQEFVF